MDLYREPKSKVANVCQYICIGTNVIMVLMAIFLVLRINTVVINVNDLLPTLATQLNETIPNINNFFIHATDVLPHVDTLVLSTTNAIPNVNALVLQVNSSLPVYTNAVSKLNITDIQANMDHISDMITNLTALANKVAHYFHIG